MYMSRDIMHCKPGKAKELVEKFKHLGDALQKRGVSVPRIYTDVSGEDYWTVVMETDVENIDDFAEMARQTGTDPDFAEAFKGYHDLVVEGRREIYKLESVPSPTTKESTRR